MEKDVTEREVVKKMIEDKIADVDKRIDAGKEVIAKSRQQLYVLKGKRRALIVMLMNIENEKI
jgi:hypothetical protein